MKCELVLKQKTFFKKNMFFFVLKQQNKTHNFSALLFGYFYPAVPNFNHNEHSKPVVNRSTVIGTLTIHFIWSF